MGRMSGEAPGLGCASLQWLRGGSALHLLVMHMQLVEPAYNRIILKVRGEGESCRDLCL